MMQTAVRNMDTHDQPLALQSAELLRENQKLITIGRLSGSIAHEINNPLESVTNLLFLMENHPDLSPEVRGYVRLAQDELGRAVQITRQTLNFCRETAAPVRTNLEDLLEEVVVLYARKIAEKHLKVIRQFKSNELVVVFPGEIRQVFSNLISNAIEASSAKGKLYLRVRRSRLWGDPGVTGMRVTIADNGTGIPMEARHRIGEPFFTTKGHQGTGLGLWVTQTIIQRYGGNLLLYSNTGKHHGTVFSLFFPTNLRPHPVAGPESDGEAARSVHASDRQLKEGNDGIGRRQRVS
jgi:signal transduction histidine kinase